MMLQSRLFDVLLPNELVSELCRFGILREITGKFRNRLFRYQDYLDLFTETERP
jgi:hypothetical protein